MKKLILSWITLFFLLGGTAYADHWVFIETENKAAPDAENDIGLAKRGDVIRIRPVLCEEQYCEPTPTEQSKFAIVRVSGLTDKDIEDLTAPYEDQSKQLKPIVRRQIDVGGKLIEVDPLPRDQIGTNPQTYKVVANRQRALRLDASGLDIQKGDFRKAPMTAAQLRQAVRVKTPIDLAYYRANSIRYALIERPIRIAMNKITPPAQAANVSKICAVGSNCTDENYNDLITWEAAVDGDFVTAAAGETAELYDDDGDISGDATLDGSTVNATYFWTITAGSGEEHSGLFTSGATVTDDGAGDCFEVRDEYTVISNLVCDQPSGYGFNVDGGSSGFHTFQNIVINSPGSNCFFLWIEPDVELITVQCISPGADGYWNNAATTSENQRIVDSTFYGASDEGIVGQNGSICVENVAVFDSVTQDYGTDDVDTDCSDNYASSDTSGQTGLQSLTTADQFVSLTDGSENLHLKTGSDLISAGATPTIGNQSDMDGTSRPVDTYDIGADEFESAAAPSFFPRVIVF